MCQPNDSKHSFYIIYRASWKIITYALGKHDPWSAQDWRTSSDMKSPHHSNMYHMICGGISGICVDCRILVRLSCILQFCHWYPHHYDSHRQHDDCLVHRQDLFCSVHLDGIRVSWYLSQQGSTNCVDCRNLVRLSCILQFCCSPPRSEGLPR